MVCIPAFALILVNTISDQICFDVLEPFMILVGYEIKLEGIITRIGFCLEVNPADGRASTHGQPKKRKKNEFNEHFESWILRLWLASMLTQPATK